MQKHKKLEENQKIHLICANCISIVIFVAPDPQEK